jgi:hypothetical protein
MEIVPAEALKVVFKENLKREKRKLVKSLKTLIYWVSKVIEGNSFMSLC